MCTALTMEDQLLIALAVTALTIVLGSALIMFTANHHTKQHVQLCQPVMETRRAKGKLITGNKDYKTKQVTTIAVQETARA